MIFRDCLGSLGFNIRSLGHSVNRLKAKYSSLQFKLFIIIFFFFVLKYSNQRFSVKLEIFLRLEEAPLTNFEGRYMYIWRRKHHWEILGREGRRRFWQEIICFSWILDFDQIIHFGIVWWCENSSGCTLILLSKVLVFKKWNLIQIRKHIFLFRWNRRTHTLQISVHTAGKDSFTSENPWA